MMRQMKPKFSRVRRLNTTMSSTRLMNSGRRKSSSAALTFTSSAECAVIVNPAGVPSAELPALVVIISTVFSKLTVLPCASVMRPSSRI